MTMYASRAGRARPWTLSMALFNGFAVLVNGVAALGFRVGTLGALLALGAHFALLFIVLALAATLNVVVLLRLLNRHASP